MVHLPTFIAYNTAELIFWFLKLLEDYTPKKLEGLMYIYKVLTRPKNQSIFLYGVNCYTEIQRVCIELFGQVLKVLLVLLNIHK